MSLINDALKRAREAQPPAAAAAAPGPQLRPVEQAHPARQGLGLALLFGLALVALIVLFWLWQLSQKNGAARSAAAPSQPAAGQNAAAPAEPVPPLVPSTNPPVSISGTASNAVPAPASLVSSAAAVLINIASNSPATPDLVSSQPAQTNPAAIPAETLPPKPAPLKLQAIVFHPIRPSAMINGRPLFVGDHLGEFQVQAIGQESVTLVSGEKTNVLSLFQ